MKIFIDACNIRGGGGITHLRELLDAVDLSRHTVSEVYLCAFADKIDSFPDHDWLIKLPVSDHHQNAAARFYWQQLRLGRILKEISPDILFSPGGIIPLGISIPKVTMSQNLQPFDPSVVHMYRALDLSHQLKMRLRYSAIHHFQKNAFKCSDGVIFLTEHGKAMVLKNIGGIKGQVVVIPHGINRKFFRRPCKQKDLNFFSDQDPFRFLYVSTVNVYKYQWNVAKAVQFLREKGFPVAVDFIGPAFAGLNRLENAIYQAGPHGRFMRYLGPVPYDELEMNYHSANAFIFASTCETFGQVLLEAMASGLPIASSGCQPMKEILGQTAVYFDPNNSQDIANSLEQLCKDRNLREYLSEEGLKKASPYSWDECARKTFDFIKEVYCQV